MATRRLRDQSAEILKHPARFAVRVLKGFRANQGLLLAGAVAYYTLLSLIPLLILLLIALSHVIAEARLLAALSEYLEFVVPGQAPALVDGLRAFFAHREVISGALLVVMILSSALAFTVLENAMLVIFYHRVAIRRRRFIVSALLPYVFMMFLGLGLLVVTFVSGRLAVLGAHNVTIFGMPHALGELSNYLLYVTGVVAKSSYSRRSISECQSGFRTCGTHSSVESRRRSCGRSRATRSCGTTARYRKSGWSTARWPPRLRRCSALRSVRSSYC
jgi:uncharacterized BrkB/YihY/UPF0761 family membrane protein